MHTLIGTTWKTHVFFEETNPSMSGRKELWEKTPQQPHIHRITHYHNLLPTQQHIARTPTFLRFIHCLTPTKKPTYLKVATPGHKGIVTREGCHKKTQDLFHNTWIEDLQSRGGVLPAKHLILYRSVVGCLEKVPKMLSFHGAFSWWFSSHGIDSKK